MMDLNFYSFFYCFEETTNTKNTVQKLQINTHVISKKNKKCVDPFRKAIATPYRTMIIDMHYDLFS